MNAMTCSFCGWGIADLGAGLHIARKMLRELEADRQVSGDLRRLQHNAKAPRRTSANDRSVLSGRQVSRIPASGQVAGSAFRLA
jgi:hypothetical protein